LNIFHNPDLPTIDDYYEPWDYDYEQLITSPKRKHQPAIRPRSQLEAARRSPVHALIKQWRLALPLHPEFRTHMNDANVCHAQSTRGAALAWASLAFFGGFGGVSAFGPIVSQLKDSLAMSPLLMGLLAASPALSGSLLRIPFGAMVDRMGGKKPILILLSLAAAGIAGITAMFWFFPEPVPSHYPAFLFFGVLCGSGIAVFSVGVPTVSYWHPQRRQGSALALYAGLGNLAPGVFAVLLPFMVVSLGFSISYVLWFAASVFRVLGGYASDRWGGEHVTLA
jgi:nitrate/nitrite transporter NarK